MPIHWTYKACTTRTQLFQGDILARTKGLLSILQEVHPHFIDTKYTAFLLTTQSCDLALYKGRCKTKYLNIAVVRPIDAVLHDLISHVCRPVGNGVYLQETKGEANDLFNRVFNQNEHALGLFYLHPDVKAGIGEPSVALLRVTVSLRAEHYNVLRKARRRRLSVEFCSKLGWLLGNLYSRVGTQDWSGSPERSKDLEKLVNECLNPGDDAPYGPIWVPETLVAAARNKGIRLDKLERDKVSPTLEAHRPLPAKDQIIDRASVVLKDMMPDIDDDTLRRIKNRLNNDRVFAKAVRLAKSE